MSEISKTDDKRKIEYELRYRRGKSNEITEYIEIRKKWVPYWGLGDEIEIVWKIDHSDSPNLNISVYSVKKDKEMKNEKVVSEIQMKFYNIDEIPFYLRGDLQTHEVLYGKKDTIKKIIADLIEEFKKYGLVADAILEDD
ncbi:MAG: hypothetical protein ACP5HH_07260 [Fervidicoccaceae archaeon]